MNTFLKLEFIRVDLFIAQWLYIRIEISQFYVIHIIINLSLKHNGNTYPFKQTHFAFWLFFNAPKGQNLRFDKQLQISCKAFLRAINYEGNVRSTDSLFPGGKREKSGSGFSAVSRD